MATPCKSTTLRLIRLILGITLCGFILYGALTLYEYGMSPREVLVNLLIILISLTGKIGTVIILLPIYFAPAIVGWNRRHHSAIFATNLLLGWTLIGWAAALIWALAERDTSKLSQV